jgi:uncharacterized membrane protein YedE/YeeE
MRRTALILPAVIALLAITHYAGIRAGFLLLLGLGFGAALSGARFGFTTGWRDLLTRKDPWGMVGQMVLMALCALLAFPLLAQNGDEIFGAVSPITWSLILGALVFGFAMQLADGCGSGTLYKAGASSPISWAVLPAFIFGSFLGAAHQPAWVSLGGPLELIGLQAEAAPIDLILLYGQYGALAITLLLCLTVAGISLWVAGRAAAANKTAFPKVPKRWLWGAVVIAVLYAAHLVIAGQPWGIVYGLGLWGAKIVSAVGVDLSMNAFWGAAPHADRLIEPVLWDVTSVTNIGLLYGALIASRWHLEPGSKTLWPSASTLIISIGAGLTMGYSSRLAFGCNVGAYLGGVASASVHGWIWFVFAFIGSIYGVKMRQKAGIT